MNELDDRDKGRSEVERRLEELAIAAQKATPKSSQRRLAISQLIDLICRSPQLGHPQKGMWSANFYTDIYHEALQKTLLEVCQKIELYNPQYPVMAWVNFRLNKQFINVLDDYRKQGITNIPKSRQQKIVCLPNIANLENYLSASNSANNEILLQKFIEQDPENLMVSIFIKDRPSLTFQIIAKAKLVEELTWTEIGNKFQVPPTTICSFFSRNLKRLTPYFKKYLQK